MKTSRNCGRMRQHHFFRERHPAAFEKHTVGVYQQNAFDKIQSQRLNESKEPWYKKEGP